MTATFFASLFSPIYCADFVPWFGSVKHTWNTLSPAITSVEDAEGVTSNMLSCAVLSATATHGVVVTVPISTCIPQSFKVLYALTDFSASLWSSWKLNSIFFPLMPPASLISSTAICAPFITAVP